MKRLFGKSKKLHLTPKGDGPHPMYEYAMHEYQQTVAPHSSNDDGRIMSSSSAPLEQPSLPLAESTARRKTPNVETSTETKEANAIPTEEKTPTQANRKAPATTAQTPTPTTSASQTRTFPPEADPSPVASDVVQPSTSHLDSNNSIDDDDLYFHNKKPHRPIHHQGLEMPDTTYQERYGDAYVGGTIKYVYPSGYQSMRPRGGPWKLSVAICVLFTFLSVFIVGHCSDRADRNQQYNDKMDDDMLVIETRWCGSRPLYLMWAISMLMTGLAAAYCSVIGYIKVRDFVVANARSQPPGMVGSSDYYVRIADHYQDGSPPGSDASHSSSQYQYQKTIYQADGTPQFWGGHIYRPTQAAVAVTSR